MKQPAFLLPSALQENQGRLLLHACCAPCSSPIVEWMLNNGVQPTIYYYNPNIWPREEYLIRKEESQRHATLLGIDWIDGDYDHRQWLADVRGLEQEPERGRRCLKCFTLRLTATARMAHKLGMRYFATTLASSRWKNLEQITHAGLVAQQVATGTEFWAQNWRKGGLQERRGQLLRQYQFYNQQYCGCEFSACQGLALTKPILRQQMRMTKQQHTGRMAQWSVGIVERLANLISQHRQAAPLSRVPHPFTVLTYWPLSDEPDIRLLTDRLATEGVTVLLPCVTGSATMELRQYAPENKLCEGAFHIMEPRGPVFADYGQIDLALIPGVAFDAAGHRLGRGRGYYDRLLSKLSPQTRKIGVCFACQRVAEVPTEAHDVAMDEIIC